MNEWEYDGSEIKVDIFSPKQIIIYQKNVRQKVLMKILNEILEK